MRVKKDLEMLKNVSGDASVEIKDTCVNLQTLPLKMSKHISSYKIEN